MSSGMTYENFQQAIAPIVTKWPKSMDTDRQALIWKNWKYLPLTPFAKAIEALIYQCNSAPTGKTIDAAIVTAWRAHKLEFSYKENKATDSHEPLSKFARKHLDWVFPDSYKYSGKLCGIFNTVQRSMLVNDQRGMRGITVFLKISEEEACSIYELMLQGNVNNPLIKRHNDNWTNREISRFSKGAA